MCTHPHMHTNSTYSLDHFVLFSLPRILGLISQDWAKTYYPPVAWVGFILLLEYPIHASVAYVALYFHTLFSGMLMRHTLMRTIILFLGFKYLIYYIYKCRNLVLRIML